MAGSVLARSAFRGKAFLLPTSKRDPSVRLQKLLVLTQPLTGVCVARTRGGGGGGGELAVVSLGQEAPPRTRVGANIA